MDTRIARLAAAQHGVFHRHQAAALGVTRGHAWRRQERGRWHQPAPGVYRLAGAPRTWRQDLMIACLAWGDGSAVSHRAAAALRSLARFEDELVELTVPPTRRRKAPAIVHRGVLLGHETDIVDDIPVTSVARTLIDLAGVADIRDVEVALDDALRRRLVTAGWLTWSLRQLPSGRRGSAVMRSLLRARGAAAVPESPLETETLQLLREAGLPEPLTQYEIVYRGRTIARVDFAYPKSRLAIEVDGFRYHSIYTDWQRDRERLNAIVTAGWRIIHVTRAQLLGDRERLVRTIRAAVEAGRA